jgi:hypothetical protein
MHAVAPVVHLGLAVSSFWNVVADWRSTTPAETVATARESGNTMSEKRIVLALWFVSKASKAVIIQEDVNVRDGKCSL